MSQSEGDGQHARARSLKPMDRSIKLLQRQLSRWLADQELPVIIGLIIAMFVSWGIYPILVR